MTGATAMAAVGGGHHSVFATILLALLALGMAHAFTVEIQRQAHRRAGRWGRNDLINTVLLASWAVASLTIAGLPYPPVPVRILGLLLTFSYTAASAYFVAERRRAILADAERQKRPTSPQPEPSHPEPASPQPEPVSPQAETPAKTPVETPATPHAENPATPGPKASSRAEHPAPLESEKSDPATPSHPKAAPPPQPASTDQDLPAAESSRV